MEPEARRSRPKKKSATPANDAPHLDGSGAGVTARKLQESKEDKLKCRKQGWLDEEEKMLFQIWDQEKKCLVASPNQEPLQIAEVLKILREVVPLISPDHVLKSHAQRPLKGMTEAENKAVFNLEVSLRAPEAHTLYGHVLRLAGSSCWQIIGTQVRRDTQRRTGAIQALQRLAYGAQGGRKHCSMSSHKNFYGRNLLTKAIPAMSMLV